MSDSSSLTLVSLVVCYICAGVLIAVFWAGVINEEDDDTVLLSIPLWPLYAIRQIYDRWWKN